MIRAFAADLRGFTRIKSKATMRVVAFLFTLERVFV